MPSEQDKKIEKLVQAYAEKRRRESGPPLEMPSATRRLLQAELTRRHPKTAGEAPSFLQLLLNSWSRLALAASIVMVLGVVIWFSNSKQRSPTDLAQDMKQPVEDLFAARDQTSKDSPAGLEVAAKARKPGLPLASPSDKKAGETPSASVPAKETQWGLAANKRADLNLSREEPLPPKGGQMTGGGFGGAADANGREVHEFFTRTPEAKQKADFGFANTNAAPLSEALGERADGLAERHDFYSLGFAPTNSSKLALNLPLHQTSAKNGLAFFDQLGLADTEVQLRRAGEPASPVPVTSTPTAASSSAKENFGRNLELSKARPSTPPVSQELEGLAKKSLDGDLVHFSQSAEPFKAERPQNQNRSIPLSSFELEQRGDQIRIYDADGSVYVGQLSSAVDNTSRFGNLSTVNEKAKSGLEVSPASEARSFRRGLKSDDGEPGRQKISFQARGTNRSLDELVVINGSLIAGTDAKEDTKRQGLGEAEIYNRPAGPSLAPSAPVRAPDAAARVRSIAAGQSPAGSATPALPALNPQAQNQPVSVMRIQGRARIGPTNEFEINAIRAPR